MDFILLFLIVFLGISSRLLYIHFLCCIIGIFLFGQLGNLIFTCFGLFFNLLGFYRNLHLYRNCLFLKMYHTIYAFLCLLVVVFIMALRLSTLRVSLCITLTLFGRLSINHFLSLSRELKYCHPRRAILPSS